MIFRLTAMSHARQGYGYSFQHEDLEGVYQLLHALVESGDTLGQVTLLDHKGRLALPLEALTEPDFVNPMGALRQQWETVLRRPMGHGLSPLEVRQQLLGHRQERLALVRRTVVHIHDLVERTHQQLRESPERASLLAYYQRQLEYYSRLLIKLETAS